MCACVRVCVRVCHRSSVPSGYTWMQIVTHPFVLSNADDTNCGRLTNQSALCWSEDRCDVHARELHRHVR
jgi:hypothetical protein